MINSQKKNRIAFFFPSFHLGGVEKVMITLANEFARKGLSVDVVVSSNKGELKSDLVDEIRVIDLKGFRLAFSFWKLFLYYTKEKPHAVISGPTYPNIISIVVSKFCKTPPIVIITHHNFYDIETKNLGFKGKITPLLIKSLYNYASNIVAVSESVLEDLISNFSVKRSLVTRIYNPVLDDLFYERSKIHTEFKLPFGFDNLIVSIGRMEKIKNFDLIIDAFSELKKDPFYFKTKLVLIGDGHEFDRLQKKVIELDLSNEIILTGSIVNPLPILKKAKLFIQTSYQESFSIVIVEALALDIKVITTKTSGATEILGNDYDGYTKFDDVECLTEKIKKYYDSKNISVNSIDISRYSIKLIYEQYRKLIFS